MSIEAMRLALDALEVAESWGTWHRGSEAITALRAALAEATIKDNLTVEPVAYVTGFSKGYATVQPVDPCLLMCVGMALYRSPPTINEMETVEPVAWLQIGVGDHEGTVIVTTTEPKTWNPAWWKFKPLYTAPTKRKPLTDDEISRIDDATPFHENVEWEVRFARAIERAHGIGGEE